MAKKKKSTASKANNTSFQGTAAFDKAMVTDINDYHLPENAWTYARNAINNSRKGDLGKLSNEPANLFCTSAPFNIIGNIHIEKDVWAIFSTNNFMSEIGLFTEGTCKYEKLVRSSCLKFKSSNLIKGVAKPNAFCSFDLVWADGRNPDRIMDINNIPWVEECTDDDGCKICTPKLDSNDEKILDCDKLRLETAFKTPYAKVKKGDGIGTLGNGTYHVHLAYLVNGEKITDYTSMSNTISLFTHDGVNGSITVEISNLDVDMFDEYVLVLVSTIAEKTVARTIGSYSTGINVVTIDNVNLELPVVPLKELGIITTVPDKSQAIFSTGKYLLRVTPTDKFDFNYQPLANQIKAHWNIVEYPKDYYKNGGTKVGYMRDEVYAFFIRWIYNTGDKSAAYHIPGRGPVEYTLTNDDGSAGITLKENAEVQGSVQENVIEDYTPKVFEVFNTATYTGSPNITLPDGGIIKHTGRMGYYESLELYPDNNPTVWNASANPWSYAGSDEYDLCGKPIRHHKFPENFLNYGGSFSDVTNHHSNDGQKINILGVSFSNIKPPVDNNGKVLKNIVGYEILRSSRDGNKTVFYKGLINNMFQYDLPSKITKRKALYPNYPYNDLSADPFISKKKTKYDTFGGLQNHVPNNVYSKKHFTFNSPDLQFARPFLNASELKIYGVAHGYSEGRYIEATDHPKHKFFTDFALLMSFIAGIGYAVTKNYGKKGQRFNGYKIDGSALPYAEAYGAATGTGNIGLAVPFMATYATTINAALKGAALAAQATANTVKATDVQKILDAILGTNTYGLSEKTLDKAVKLAAQPGSTIVSGSIDELYDDQDQTPKPLKIMQAIPMFLTNVTTGANTSLDLIKALSDYNQFAFQYVSSCEYKGMHVPEAKNRRRKIDDARYLDSKMQDFQDNYIVNNVFRQTTAMFNTFKDVENTKGVTDVSRPKRISEMADEDKFSTNRKIAASHYVAFKNPNRRQYGQLNSIKMIPTKTNHFEVSINSAKNTFVSGIVYGGDTYIGTYSEKNTLFYFTNWLESIQGDGMAFDYTKYKMFDFTSFWMNTTPFNLSEFSKSIGDGLVSAIKSLKFSNFVDSIKSPSDLACFDRKKDTGNFMLKNCYMYLFNSGVKNFFVESELNIDCRDWEDEDAKKHYPIQSDVTALFNMRVIKADNFYKLDRSLCESFLPHSKVPWGVLQDLRYNPALAETCYTTRENRVLYSLPQETMAKKNAWSVFLPNNYKDFTSKVVSIKPVDRTGAMMFFENEPPAMLPGVDELQTSNGTKLLIGDGGLFARELQRISHSDKSLEYGSCQSRLSVVNTPNGIFWMSTNQGKIFVYAGGLKEVSLKNNRYWLNRYLPFQLLEDFPTFDMTDNPVAGIGCQTVYDNEYMLVYFCKKDYKLKDEFKNSPKEYLGNGVFSIDGFATFLDNPYYFENASFTLSYDPKAEEFVSYHDWQPDLTLSGKNNFLTTKGTNLWIHNKSCQKFCNFYNEDYPFEVEFQLDNKFAVSTIRNIEYYLESYKYAENCYDRFHILDHNFDEAIIHNSEQCSGLLKLALEPKNDIKKLLQYPKVGIGIIEILYSKEEQQYRFNQFWDITKNRGEYVDADENIWITAPNGYIRELNFKNLNYKKEDFQRKKFRHFNNKVLLRRNVCDNVEMLISVAFANQHLSPR